MPEDLRFGDTEPSGHEAESVRSVSDTALWVAAYRAEESERPDALFSDPLARRLAGERGFRLLDAMPNGRRFAWPMVIRTVLFDTLLRDRIAAGTDVVVNLAANRAAAGTWTGSGGQAIVLDSSKDAGR